MSEEQHIPIYDAQEPSEESKQLVTLFHDLESRQLDFLDEAAKSVIERVATFLAILFGVTAFGSTFPPPYLKDNAAAKAFVIVTLLLYLVALGAGMWAIQPRYYRPIPTMSVCWQKSWRRSRNARCSGCASPVSSLRWDRWPWPPSSSPSSGTHNAATRHPQR